MKEKVSKKFNELYGEGAILFASPGRINLIGEHTDYNGGFVFPGAVDKGIVAAIRLNGTDKVRAYALDLGESSEFGLNEADKPAEQLIIVPLVKSYTRLIKYIGNSYKPRTYLRCKSDTLCFTT